MNIFINISGVYDAEGRRLSEAETLDLRELEGCQCYCDSEAEEKLRSALAPYPAGGVHWIDTGDYHYLSKLWMEKIDEPFVLALFDNHPDDQRAAFGDLLSCGGWVQSARDSLPLMKADYLNAGDVPGSLPVYLSLDLDLLSRDCARTDWDQGDWTLDTLMLELERIADGHRIIGADVCGGITIAKGATDEDLALNAATRSRLQAFLDGLVNRSGRAE